MNVVHFSDLHVWRPVLDWRDAWYPKRILGLLNLLFHRRHLYPPELARRVLASILEEDADCVVFTGDVSTAALDAEFEGAARLFAPLRDKWADRFLMLPGNHDLYTPLAVRDGRFRRHFPYALTDERAVSRREIDGPWSVVAIQSSRPYALRSNGSFTPELAARLRAELETARADGRSVLLAGHFPYATPPGASESWSHRLIGADRLAAVVQDFAPPAYLHGHKHRRWAIRPASTPATVCVNSGSSGLRHRDPARRAGYVVLDIDAGCVRRITAVAIDPASGKPHRAPLSIEEMTTP